MTPQIDNLAGEGVNFQRAMSECPVCVPARRILMTGMGPYGVHMNVNRDRQPLSRGPQARGSDDPGGVSDFCFR